MERKYSFAPLADNRSKVLILGSLPGAESLRKQQYYGNPQNVFWRIIYAVFDSEPEIDYTARCVFILKNKLALWDVCRSAERSGSADSKIAAVESNDIAGLLCRYPDIDRVLLNGRKAESEYNRYYKDLPVSTIYVPSTSPAFAAIPFTEKLKIWREALML